jgi:hypothetical protein
LGAEDWTRCFLRASTRGELRVDIAHRRVWLWDGEEDALGVGIWWSGAR